jgi:hypothetical protein
MIYKLSEMFMNSLEFTACVFGKILKTELNSESNAVVLDWLFIMVLSIFVKTQGDKFS